MQLSTKIPINTSAVRISMLIIHLPHLILTGRVPGELAEHIGQGGGHGADRSGGFPVGQADGSRSSQMTGCRGGAQGLAVACSPLGHRAAGWDFSRSGQGHGRESGSRSDRQCAGILAQGHGLTRSHQRRPVGVLHPTALMLSMVGAMPVTHPSWRDTDRFTSRRGYTLRQRASRGVPSGAAAKPGRTVSCPGFFAPQGWDVAGARGRPCRT